MEADFYIIQEEDIDFDKDFVDILGKDEESCIVVDKKDFFDSIDMNQIDIQFRKDFDRANNYINGNRIRDIEECESLLNTLHLGKQKAILTQRVFHLGYKMFYKKINKLGFKYHIGEMQFKSDDTKINNYFVPETGIYESSKLFRIFHTDDDGDIVVDSHLKITISFDFYDSEYVVIDYKIGNAV
jgi:hypothetical protein